jgi:hypothetical protein
VSTLTETNKAAVTEVSNYQSNTTVKKPVSFVLAGIVLAVILTFYCVELLPPPPPTANSGGSTETHLGTDPRTPPFGGYFVCPF